MRFSMCIQIKGVYYINDVGIGCLGQINGEALWHGAGLTFGEYRPVSVIKAAASSLKEHTVFTCKQSLLVLFSYRCSYG